MWFVGVVTNGVRTCPKPKEISESKIWAYSEVSLWIRVDSIVHIHTVMGIIPTDIKNTKGYRRPMVLLVV